MLPDPTLPGPVPPAQPQGLVPESTELTLSKNTGEDEPDAGADKDLYIYTYIYRCIQTNNKQTPWSVSASEL
jgi:hypothetical protein